MHFPLKHLSSDGLQATEERLIENNKYQILSQTYNYLEFRSWDIFLDPHHFHHDTHYDRYIRAFHSDTVPKDNDEYDNRVLERD